MSQSITALRIFEKESIASFLAKVHEKTEASMERKVAKITTKIDEIHRFMEKQHEMFEL